MESFNRKPMMELPPVAGIKRPVEDLPTLLPAFEPVSSSPPQLPRPSKRITRASPDRCSLPKQSPSKYHNERLHYPTPVPTSSTGIFSSSPPQFRTRRPRLQRTTSTISERAPLASVRSVELNINGDHILMGRSTRSAHIHLSGDAFISRVHVKAAFAQANAEHSDRIVIECFGRNGATIHCQGQTWCLDAGDTFLSGDKEGDVMVDVNGARVLLRWPAGVNKASTPESEGTPSPSLRFRVLPSPFSSPIHRRTGLQSPPSLSPIRSSLNGSGEGAIKIYEDEENDEEDNKENEEIDVAEPTQSTQIMSQIIKKSQDESEVEDFPDQDEENEPIVHSFGPFGHNILPRLESFTTYDTKSPKRAMKPEHTSPIKKEEKESTTITDESNPVLNHVINQLAYSRLSSTPLSMLLNNIPANLREEHRVEFKTLKVLIDRTACIGEVRRAGKDAAGKPLESEYYYNPDEDFDSGRRDAVVEGLRKPGLRNCRKQHKVQLHFQIYLLLLTFSFQQYYWRKPKF
jgi:hypothetical protein